MSNRVIRGDIVSSERVTALHYETRWLYLALVLAADDYGLVPLSYGEIRRAAPLDSWTREKVEAMLGELVDKELLLSYNDTTGRRFGAITRWRSVVNSQRPRWPIPSWGMGHVMQPYGFKDSRTKHSASLILKHLDIESGPPAEPRSSTSPPPVTEGVRGKGEGIKEKEKKPPPTSPWKCPDGVTAEAWTAWLEVRKRLRSPMTEFAYKRAIGQIEGWTAAGHNPDAIVAASASNGWKGLFEPKTAPVSAGPKDGDKRMTKWGEETYSENQGGWVS